MDSEGVAGDSAPLTCMCGWRESLMCVALTPSDHSGSRRPKAKCQAARGRREKRECGKSRPLSVLVRVGRGWKEHEGGSASQHEKERDGRTRVTGGNYVCLMSVYAENGHHRAEDQPRRERGHFDSLCTV